MTTPYKRRRGSLVRGVWIYRKLIALAMVLGLMLWFIWANNTAVTVAFPFGLGSFSSTVGLVILLSSLVGSVITGLALTLLYTLKRRRDHAAGWSEGRQGGLPDDRPPSDYAAKTTDGFSDTRWS